MKTKYTPHLVRGKKPLKKDIPAPYTYLKVGENGCGINIQTTQK